MMRDFAGAAASGSGVTVAHELLLLTLAMDAAPRERSLDRALAGGLLGELALRGVLRVAPATVQLSPIALDALPHLRGASPVLGLVLEQLLATREPYPPAEWVAVLALRGPELHRGLLRELESARILAPTPCPPGARHPAARQPLALLDAAPTRIVRERLRAVTLHGAPATPRDRLQLALLLGCGLDAAVFSASELRSAGIRLHELTHDQPIAAAVRRPCRPRAEVQRRARTSDERLSDLLAWLGLPAALVDRLAFFWRG